MLKSGFLRAAFFLSAVFSTTSGTAANELEDLLRLGVGIMNQSSQQSGAGTSPAPRASAPSTPSAPRAQWNEQVYEIQRLLNTLGYDAGPTDGEMGPRTKNAIMTYQRNSGLPVTGVPDQLLLDRLSATVQGGFAAAPQAGGAGENVPQFQILNGFDLPSGDYRSGMTDPALRGITMNDCLAICLGDSQCRAFTFNQPLSTCNLKNTQPIPSQYFGAISGLKKQPASVGSAGGQAVAGTQAPAPVPDTAAVAPKLPNFLTTTEAGSSNSATSGEPRASGSYRDYVMMVLKADLAAYLNFAEYYAVQLKLLEGNEPECDRAYKILYGGDAFAVKDYFVSEGNSLRAMEAEIRKTRGPYRFDFTGEYSLGYYDFDRGGFPVSISRGAIDFSVSGEAEIPRGAPLPNSCTVAGYENYQEAQQFYGASARREGLVAINPYVAFEGVAQASFLPMDEASARAFGGTGFQTVKIRTTLDISERPQGRGALPGRVVSMVFLHPETEAVLAVIDVAAQSATDNQIVTDGPIPWTHDLTADVVARDVLEPIEPSALFTALTQYFGTRAQEIAGGNVPEGVPLPIEAMRGKVAEEIVAANQEALRQELIREVRTLPIEVYVSGVVARYYDPATAKLTTGNLIRKEGPSDDGFVFYTPNNRELFSHDWAMARTFKGTVLALAGLSSGLTLKLDRDLELEPFTVSVEEAVRRGLVGSSPNAQDELTMRIEFSILGSEPAPFGQPMVRANLRRVVFKWSSDGQVLGDFDFSDQPTYAEEVAANAPKSAAQLAVQPIPENSPMTAEVADLLQTKFLPDTVDDRHMKRMMLNRWMYEVQYGAQEQDRSWGRFYVDRDQPFEEVNFDALLPSFKEWTVARAQSVPTRLTVDVPLNAGVPTFYNWGGFDGGQLALTCNSHNINSWAGGAGTERAVKATAICGFLEKAWSVPDQYLFLKDSSFQGGVENAGGRGPRGYCGNDFYCRDMAWAKEQAGTAQKSSTGQTQPNADIIAVDKLPAIDVLEFRGVDNAVVRFDLEVTGAEMLDTWPDTAWRAALLAVKPISESVGMGISGLPQDDTPVKALVDSVQFTAVVHGAQIVNTRTGEVLKTLDLAPIPQLPLEMLGTTEPAAAVGGQYDVLGLSLGLPFEDAEALIRSHMEVTSVLVADRATQMNALAGKPAPYSSGKIFAADGDRELIAIFDEPPAAGDKVVALWRRLLVPAGTVDAASLKAQLVQKYGEPVASSAGTSDNQIYFIWSNYPPANGCGEFSEEHQTDKWTAHDGGGYSTEYLERRYFPTPFGHEFGGVLRTLERYARDEAISILETEFAQGCNPFLSVRLRTANHNSLDGTSAEIVFMMEDGKNYGRHYLDSLLAGPQPGGAVEGGAATGNVIKF